MKNLFGYTRVLTVGDIHGVYDKLIKLMDKICFSPEDDLLVFLGDYIDRGPDSVKCLQYVFDLQHSQPESVVCLLGNHEVMMTSYFMQKHGSYNNLIEDYADAWLDNGGFETLRQLNKLDRERREELVEWAANLPVQFRYQEFFFCHAGIDAGLPLEVQNEFDMLWKREGWRDKYNGKETIVVGHTPVQKVKKQVDYLRRVPKPLFLPNNIIMCDTGVYMTGGKLSCVDVLSRKVWQQ
jgi:serine/threonine protein phosphatase 1